MFNNRFGERFIPLVDKLQFVEDKQFVIHLFNNTAFITSMKNVTTAA